MTSRTYTGASPSGTVDLGTRTAAFTKGVPLEVSDDEAARLDRSGGWSKPARKPKADKAEPESPQGDQPEHKEP